ncbi:preprotein translocase subunit YajC [Bifidobacterium vespertilionis]|uniref:Preprotein translocase subunit YajC n=1 Tax=Bifidobacterium vespertilionis TaxID=2562524 RepID=A0A5J5E0M5_9BIFI|nr:preprotein translocase subunit YajC [Bifidobacterium vespertilionis]KAA8822593.1 preprotein translocase subunit YajC [Bifidobacterium vespertilionis]KAA8824122.1 preprotein translocase subunit YajC [Bifidobacterium vespertilionis]
MPFDPSMLFMIVILVFMIGMMWWQSKKAKKQQAKVNDFRESLQTGTEVATYSGLLGKIVSVDLEKEQAVIDSEGSLSRWRLQALTEPPIVPAYVHDDEVDEYGNRLEDKADDQSQQDEQDADEAQKPIEATAEQNAKDEQTK